MVVAGGVVVAACGLDTEGIGADNPDGSGAVGGALPDSGGGGLGGTTCFPGAKVCPDPSGQPKCELTNKPELGCGSGSCDPCVLENAIPKCGATDCEVDQCSPSFANCDGDHANGCETNLDFAPTNCGSCGNDCTAGGTKPNWICENGKCAVTDCVPPTTGNCDGDKTNGCEVDLLIDPNNCGYCTKQCNLPSANSACSGGNCVVTTCKGANANCDNQDANGCEINTSTDKNNCGGCGKVCSSNNGVAGCLLGNCVIFCTPGFDNCDGNVANGCETNVNNTLAHCGGCNKPCNPANVNNAVCNGGKCEYDSCKSGWGDCDGNKANGCERNLLTSTNHCGSCGNNCNPPSGGSAVCNNGTCGFNCTGGLTKCGANCVDTKIDVGNCSSCGNACSCGVPNCQPTCSNSTCGFNCTGGTTKCGANCVNTSTDISNCGTCNNNCPVPGGGGGSATCSGGSCGGACSGGKTLCGSNPGTCIDTSSDPAHCSSCGNACPPPPTGNGTAKCTGGTCGFNCTGGTSPCAGGCFNFQNDSQHCGNCTTVCGANESCQSGSCECNSGFDKCGGTCVNFQTDKNHCGGCNNPCNTNQTCQGGQCKGGSSDAGTD